MKLQKKVNRVPGGKVEDQERSGSPRFDRKLLVPLALVLLVTAIIYIPAASNEWVNWDDYGYVVDNQIIREFSLKNLVAIFTTLEQEGNYHPLTMLTYNIEYQFFHLNPHGYHVVNICLHLLNTALVFWLMSVLSGKRGVSFIVSLLFGIHPLHVESVAWVSERKDLLYTFFYLGALISYLYYIKKGGRKKYYAGAFLLFILSVLSKAMAVSLPAVFLLMDFFVGRKFDKKVILEKVPFFVVGVAFGVVALIAQQAAKAIHGFTAYSLFEKCIFACYGFITYLVKLVVPTKFSAFYPFPEKVNGVLPASLWLYPIFVVVLAGVVLYSLKYTRKVFFGAAFFAITVFLVLQLLQVGGAVMADRYSYIPSIGFFYVAAEGLQRFEEKMGKSSSLRRTVLRAALAGYALWLAVTTWTQAAVWHDSFTLWTDVLSKQLRIPFAYGNRGYAYYKIGKYDAAIADYNNALQLDSQDAGTYHNRGVAYYGTKRYDAALADYNKALELKLSNAEVYNNRGAAFAALGMSDAAIADFNKAVSMSADYAEAYNNRGTEFAKAGRLKEAIADFDKAVQLNPDYTDAKKNREVATGNLQNSTTSAARQPAEPKEESAEFYLNRGLQNGRTGNLTAAVLDFNKAIQLRPGYAEAYNDRGIVYAILQNYRGAFADFDRAVELKPDYGEAYYNRGITKRNMGNRDGACTDFRKAASMNFELALKAINETCK